MGFIYFSSHLGCPLRFENLPQTRQCEGFLVFGNFLYYDSLPETGLLPSSFVSLFIFYILPYLLLKMMGCFPGCLMSSASSQKLLCEVCSTFTCSLDEFVWEKVVSPSYSSAIFAPPTLCFKGAKHFYDTASHPCFFLNLCLSTFLFFFLSHR